jgi:ketosteroid isomerase-like protein
VTQSFVDRRSAIELVEAINAAVEKGRVDTVLALVDPDVEWRPMTRPGLSVYRGHDGTRQMFDDVARALGRYRVEYTRYDCVDDATVIGHGRVVIDGGEHRRFESTMVFRDGLLVSLDSTLVTET